MKTKQATVAPPTLSIEQETSADSVGFPFTLARLTDVGAIEPFGRAYATTLEAVAAGEKVPGADVVVYHRVRGKIARVRLKTGVFLPVGDAG